MRPSVLAMLMLTTLAPAAHADAPPIGPTARVRVEFIRETGRVPKLLHLESRVGTLASIDSTGLALVERSRREPLRLSMGEIESIFVSRGRSPATGMWRGMGWGLLGGFALAVAADAIKNGGPEQREGIGALGYLGIAAGGVATGAAVGHGLRGEDWDAYDLRQLWHPEATRTPTQ